MHQFPFHTNQLNRPGYRFPIANSVQATTSGSTTRTTDPSTSSARPAPTAFSPYTSIRPYSLNNKNFNDWKFRVNHELNVAKVKYVIDDSPDPAKKDFEDHDGMARSIIISSLTDDSLKLIKESRTAREMMEKLNFTFERKSKILARFSTLKKLRNSKCGPKDDIEEHLNSMDSIFENLSEGSEIDEIDKIIYLVLSMDGGKYEERFRYAVDKSHIEELNLDTIKKMLSRNESHSRSTPTNKSRKPSEGPQKDKSTKYELKPPLFVKCHRQRACRTCNMVLTNTKMKTCRSKIVNCKSAKVIFRLICQNCQWYDITSTKIELSKSIVGLMTKKRFQEHTELHIPKIKEYSSESDRALSKEYFSKLYKLEVLGYMPEATEEALKRRMAAFKHLFKQCTSDQGTEVDYNLQAVQKFNEW